MSNLYEALQAHHDDAQTRDEDYKNNNTVTFRPVKVDELEAVEKALGFKYPPSFRGFVLEHGAFRIGEEGDGMAFDLWEFPLGEITVLEQLKRDYEADSPEGIADNMGVEVDTIAPTEHGIVFAIQGTEDFYVFDRRSSTETDECKVYGPLLLEDADLEYYSEHSDFSKDLYFEQFIMKKLKNRSNDEDD